MNKYWPAGCATYEFKNDMRKIVSAVDEWPCRPFKCNNSGDTNIPMAKEEAMVVVVSGHLIIPFYADDPEISSARLFGYSKEEWKKAKEIVEKENGCCEQCGGLPDIFGKCLAGCS